MGTIGGKWKTSILLHLRDRTLRFGALQRSVNSSWKMLTQQLKVLEKNGLVRREVFAEVPPRVEYSLSAYGLTLQPVLDALYPWGREHYIKSQAQAMPAAPAGSPLAEAMPLRSESEALLY